MSTEQHEALIPAPLSRTDIARLWREVSGAARMTQSEEEFARRVERAALEVQHALIVQMAEALSGVLNIRNDSHGVVGYHLNGEVEFWDGFPEVSEADEAHAAATQYLKGPKT